MKIYVDHGLTESIVCCGYRGETIEDYFFDYYLHRADVTFDLGRNAAEIHQNYAEPWRSTLVDAGDKTMTCDRIERIKRHVGNEPFRLTYGDGVTDTKIQNRVAFHRQQKTRATLTAVQPSGRYGAFALNKEQTVVTSFREEAQRDGAWVNDGFFVLEPKVFDNTDGDDTVGEPDPMERRACDKQLSPYRHSGFWQSMDHLRDRMFLEQLGAGDNPPWKIL